MTVPLPRPLEVYVRAENSGDVELLSECFSPNATVRDESRTYEGLSAIKEWKADTKKKYNHTVLPLAVTTSDGKTTLQARLSGNFPGSPVTLNFRFVLKDDRIASLDIS